MTNGVSAVSASSDVTTASLSLGSSSNRPRAAAQADDTVQLSDAAQQFLTAPKPAIPDKRGMVEDLVRAAAAGDVQALALLTVA